eukprot:Plantae.Rhodophyta-Rhodochaete_pulchella.ctg22793.p1 GENE.Plantae.Rhodophyta-Rhodochaete_pulchella.ctg22793~~Plantae.Rhodophyta-Rhodochaete_pulchella.ctg22793.p1  ORF type:complete len:473 (-),score=58.45 Plantae.Rhodophyta-Rhodochaete_pulchella.ctg22793:249-1532(-)
MDYKFIRDNLAAVEANIEARNVDADANAVVELYDQVRALIAENDGLRAKRNENAAAMKSAGKMSPDERAACITEGKLIKAQVAEVEARLSDVQIQLNAQAARIPNMTHPDVPIGEESNAAILREVGAQRNFDFPIRSHVDLGAELDLFDFENAARVTGNKFYYLRNAGALLEVALISWAMSQAAARGFTPMTTPDLARENVVSGCGFAPRGEASQVYTLDSPNNELCLVGTAEIPLGGYYSGQIIDKSALPLKMAAFSHCFRQEVGAAGAVTRGLYRVHQFSKVEMFVISHPDDSERMHNMLRSIEEDMFESLGLHFKVLDMPTLDLGNPAYRKFDIEAWMSGRGSYGEISSASNCTDYQARRLNIRYRESKGDNRFVHTLNGTACAVPRMIVAILENFQREDGSVVVPEVLRPYMGGMDVIRPPIK